MKHILLLVSFLMSITIYSQSDSIVVSPSESILSIEQDSLEIHSPRKAAILSAVLPSAGQYYNKKYWKMPVVYAGLGASIYFIDYNSKKIKHFRSKLQAEIDNDPNTINDTGFSKTKLTEVVNFYKRYRDISYISLAAVYLLQIVDANVDGYLWSFDVSEDLSINATPTLLYSDMNKVGLSLRITF